MALLESGKIFYINCGLKDYIDEYGGDKTLGEYYEWFAHQFSSILNITDEEYSKIHMFITSSGYYRIGLLLPYINEYEYDGMLVLYFNNSDKNQLCSTVTNLKLWITAYNLDGDLDGVFTNNNINFYTNYIYKDKNDNIFYNDYKQDNSNLGKDYYTIIIVDTRYLNSHNFYTIECINEQNTKLNNIKEIYSAPNTFICEMVDKLNGKYSDGIFSLNKHRDIYSPYESLYQENATLSDNFSAPSIISLKPEFSENGKYMRYKDWGFYPQLFTKEKDSFSAVKVHFGRVRPRGDIYITRGDTLSELASYSSYRNMLENKDSWNRKNIIKLDDYGNKQLFSVGLNTYSMNFNLDDYNWIPIIEEKKEKEPQPEVKGYLEFSSDEDFYLRTLSKKWNGTMEYSVDDGSTWDIWDGSQINGTNTQSILVRGTGNSIITSNSSSYRWFFTGKYIKGNIETLLDYQMVLNGEHPYMKTHCYSYMFYNCTSLIEAPELLATTLTEYCYSYMFQNCTSLIKVELPATILANYCYYYMFADCVSLTKIELPATILADHCYSYMFRGCTSLTKAPELPAITLASYCYSDMFSYCTSLTKVELPATILADHCYYNMFRNCTSLIEAPKLPATTLANWCYSYMFSYCTSLTKVELPATTLANYCYYYMFIDCNSLTKAPDLPAITLTSYCYYYMFTNCTSLIEAPELIATTLAEYCYGFMFNGCSSLTKAPKLLATTLANYCCYFMFNYCTSLVEVPELSATTLTIGCYYDMFSYCTSLIEAPKLPATTLTADCYNSMFSNCTSLTKVELPATILADHCYYNMFQNCRSLTKAPDLPATTLASYCYSYMFQNCTSLTKVELPATTLANYCYYYMFIKCSSLTKAPELPAIKLANNCYYYMFASCTSLTKAPELPAIKLANSCYGFMFINCTSLTKAPELPATTLETSCYYNMFQNCTSLIEAPKLSATTLAGNCYYYMFNNCKSLTKIPELPATTLVSNCYYYMFNNCSKIKISSTQSEEYPYEYRIPKERTGIYANNALAYIFAGTGGTFKGTPTINTTYYTSNEVI